MDEVRPGYLLGERVLRHAMVRVAVAATESVADTTATNSEEHGNSVNAVES